MVKLAMNEIFQNFHFDNLIWYIFAVFYIIFILIYGFIAWLLLKFYVEKTRMNGDNNEWRTTTEWSKCRGDDTISYYNNLNVRIEDRTGVIHYTNMDVYATTFLIIITSSEPHSETQTY